MAPRTATCGRGPKAIVRLVDLGGPEAHSRTMDPAWRVWRQTDVVISFLQAGMVRGQAEAWFNVSPLAADKILYIGTIPSPIKGAP